jgi:hypothetical protein
VRSQNVKVKIASSCSERASLKFGVHAKTDDAPLVAFPLGLSLLHQTDWQNAHRPAISDISGDGVADGECPTPTPSHFIRPCAQKAEKGW